MAPDVSAVVMRGSGPEERGHVRPTSIRRERLRQALRQLRETWRLLRQSRMAIAGVAILVVFFLIALLAPVISIQDPTDLLGSGDANRIFDPPSFEGPISNWRPFGTDHFGRDVYSEVVYGSRVSLIVGFAAAALSMVLGAAVGTVAGFAKRKTDEVLMRATDVFLVLPWLPFAVLMLTLSGNATLGATIVVIGVTSWPLTARAVRAQVLSLSNRAFIDRARAAGAEGPHIIRRHVLPNVAPLLFANMILIVAIAILSEAFLAFFAIFEASRLSWGTMLYYAFTFGAFSEGAWWYVAAPGLAITILVLGFTFLGYALDAVLNPKLRRR